MGVTTRDGKSKSNGGRGSAMVKRRVVSAAERMDCMRRSGVRCAVCGEVDNAVHVKRGVRHPMTESNASRDAMNGAWVWVVGWKFIVGVRRRRNCTCNGDHDLPTEGSVAGGLQLEVDGEQRCHNPVQPVPLGKKDVRDVHQPWSTSASAAATPVR